MTPITESQIARARALIDPVFLGSPIVRQAGFDAALGCSVALKVETLNPIRSFKGRGTEALMASLTNRPTHVVATSSGNFGQGLARAATTRGVRATIFSGDDDNPGKLDAMRQLGAELRLVPRGEQQQGAGARHGGESRRALCRRRRPSGDRRRRRHDRHGTRRCNAAHSTRCWCRSATVR